MSLLGVHMHMMPCAAPCTSVSMHIAHAGEVHGTGVRNCALLVGARRTVQNYRYLLLNSCFLLALLASTVDYFLFLRVATPQMSSALDSDEYRYICCEAQLRCPRPPSPKNVVPPNSVVYRCPCVMHISVTPNFLSVSANWHSKHDRHACACIHMDISRIDPSFRASC